MIALGSQSLANSSTLPGSLSYSVYKSVQPVRDQTTMNRCSENPPEVFNSVEGDISDSIYTL